MYAVDFENRELTQQNKEQLRNENIDFCSLFWYTGDHTRWKTHFWGGGVTDAAQIEDAVEKISEKFKFDRDIEGEMCYNHKRNIQVMKV